MLAQNHLESFHSILFSCQFFWSNRSIGDRKQFLRNQGRLKREYKECNGTQTSVESQLYLISTFLGFNITRFAKKLLFFKCQRFSKMKYANIPSLNLNVTKFIIVYFYYVRLSEVRQSLYLFIFIRVSAPLVFGVKWSCLEFWTFENVLEIPTLGSQLKYIQ